MSDLITKQIEIGSLPIGTGSAIGAYLRALYLTASRKWSIVGVKVKDEYGAKPFTIFTPLTDGSTSLVSDLLLHLTTEPYHITDDMISSNYEKIYIPENDNELMRGLYRIDIPILGNAGNAQESKIFKGDFRNAFIPVSSYQGYNFPDLMIKLSGATKPLTVTLFVSECRGNFTQADATVHLDKCRHDDDSRYVIPVAGCGQRNSNCWFNISSTTSSSVETLILYVCGDKACIDDDVRQLQRLCNEYSALCNSEVAKF